MPQQSDVVLLSSIYPFISGDQSYLHARLQLKTASLLHGRVAIAATVLMKSKLLCQLVHECGAFVKEKVLQLDVREGFDSLYSFSKHDQFSQYKQLLPYIDAIDDLLPALIRYKAAPVARQYVVMLRDYIGVYRARARATKVIDILDRALARLDAAGDTFTVEEASVLCDGCYLSDRFAQVARVLYCIIGGQVIDASPSFPEGAWRRLDDRVPILDLSNLNAALIESADQFVLEWFSLDPSTIDRLTAEEILELRGQVSTEQYLTALREAVRVVEASVKAGTVPASVANEALQLQNALKARVYERCNRDTKKSKIEQHLIGGFDEAGGLGMDGSGLLRKAGVRIGSAIARRAGARILEKTTTPITAYIGNLSAKARGRERRTRTVELNEMRLRAGKR
jgi:hypothetical protein